MVWLGRQDLAMPCMPPTARWQVARPGRDMCMHACSACPSLCSPILTRVCFCAWHGFSPSLLQVICGRVVWPCLYAVVVFTHDVCLSGSVPKWRFCRPAGHNPFSCSWMMGQYNNNAALAARAAQLPTSARGALVASGSCCWLPCYFVVPGTGLYPLVRRAVVSGVAWKR